MQQLPEEGATFRAIYERIGIPEFSQKQLKLLWELLGEIPLNFDDQGHLYEIPGALHSKYEPCITRRFCYWPAGTRKSTVWAWFNRKSMGGIQTLVYAESPEKIAEHREAIMARAEVINQLLSQDIAGEGDFLDLATQEANELYVLAVDLARLLSQTDPDLAREVHTALTKIRGSYGS